MSNDDKALLQILIPLAMFMAIFGILAMSWWELRKKNKRG